MECPTVCTKAAPNWWWFLMTSHYIMSETRSVGLETTEDLELWLDLILKLLNGQVFTWSWVVGNSVQASWKVITTKLKESRLVSFNSSIWRRGLGVHYEPTLRQMKSNEIALVNSVGWGRMLNIAITMQVLQLHATKTNRFAKFKRKKKTNRNAYSYVLAIRNIHASMYVRVCGCVLLCASASLEMDNILQIKHWYATVVSTYICNFHLFRCVSCACLLVLLYLASSIWQIFHLISIPRQASKASEHSNTAIPGTALLCLMVAFSQIAVQK